MHVNESTGQVVITVDREELMRVACVMAESLSMLSRPEFYIRTGCAKPNVEELVQCMQDVADGTSTGFDLDVLAGVEVVENPPRPRR
jgi:hypothetical protein